MVVPGAHCYQVSFNFLKRGACTDFPPGKKDSVDRFWGICCKLVRGDKILAFMKNLIPSKQSCRVFASLNMLLAFRKYSLDSGCAYRLRAKWLKISYMWSLQWLNMHKGGQDIADDCIVSRVHLASSFVTSIARGDFIINMLAFARFKLYAHENPQPGRISSRNYHRHPL